MSLRQGELNRVLPGTGAAIARPPDFRSRVPLRGIPTATARPRQWPRSRLPGAWDAASLIARRLVDDMPEIAEAHCRMVSQIGRVLDEPQAIELAVRSRGDASSRRSFIVLLAATAAASLASGPAMAQTGSGYRLDQGLAIYYATIPAAIVRGHPAQHPEATMHGGVPRSPHAYHLMVAVFDAASFQRITDAEVNARVVEIGLAGEEKKLEKFAVADAITYGNYFEMRPNTLYRISLRVKRLASNHEARVEFQLRHD